MENKMRGFEAELSKTKLFRISDILNGIPLDDYQFLIPSCMVYPDSLAVDVAKALSSAEFFRFSMQEYYTLELSVYIFPHRTVVRPIGNYQEFQNSPCICGILYYDCAYLEVYVKSQEWLEQIKKNVEGMQPLMLEFITDLSDGRCEFF